MTIQCPNCNQSVLPDDSSCWHCGRVLRSASDNNVAESSANPADSQLWVYATLTSGLIIAILVLINTLGDRPLVQVRTGDITPADWSIITVGDYNMTMTLPPGWQTAEITTAEQNNTFAQELADTAYINLLTPYPNIDDWTFRFVAYSDSNFGEGTFLFVANSDALGQIANDDLETMVERNEQFQDYNLTDVDIIRNKNKSHLYLELFVDGVYCEQQALTGRDTGILFTLCAVERGNRAQIETRQIIFDSFEYLDPLFP